MNSLLKFSVKCFAFKIITKKIRKGGYIKLAH